MPKRKRDRSITFRVTEDEYASIQNWAKTCGQKQSEYIIQRALAGVAVEPIPATKIPAERCLTVEEKEAWNIQNIDHLQTLRRVTVIFKMMRFLLSKQMGIPEAEINNLIQQYIQGVQVDFPDRKDVFTL